MCLVFYNEQHNLKKILPLLIASFSQTSFYLLLLSGRGETDRALTLKHRLRLHAPMLLFYSKAEEMCISVATVCVIVGKGNSFKSSCVFRNVKCTSQTDKIFIDALNVHLFLFLLYNIKKQEKQKESEKSDVNSKTNSNSANKLILLILSFCKSINIWSRLH